MAIGAGGGCFAAGAGGRAVLLRMPAPATAGDVTEQLGLAMPEFQDVELAPVVFRKARVATAMVRRRSGSCWFRLRR